MDDGVSYPRGPIDDPSKLSNNILVGDDAASILAHAAGRSVDLAAGFNLELHAAGLAAY